MTQKGVTTATLQLSPSVTQCGT